MKKSNSTSGTGLRAFRLVLTLRNVHTLSCKGIPIIELEEATIGHLYLIRHVVAKVIVHDSSWLRL